MNFQPPRPVKDYHIDSVMDFGKYKGHTVRGVLAIDASYILWAAENVHYFRLDDETYDLAEQIVQERNDFSYHPHDDIYFGND